MAAGDPTVWAGRFRSFDERFLERVVAVWPRCLAIMPPQPDEDTITINLVNLLQRDPDTRSRFHWIEFQYEPFGYTPEGTAYSKGRVDMAVILDQDRDTYLAYECKRLNERRDGSRRSLARQYVMDGLSRFTTGQYSENLPVGCMLGYVVDGDVKHAALSVRAKIVGSIRVSQRHSGAFRGFAWVIRWESPCGSSWKTRSVFQGAVGAFCASTVPSASTGPVRVRQDDSQGGGGPPRPRTAVDR